MRANVIALPLFHRVSVKGPVPFSAVLRSVVSPVWNTRPAGPVSAKRKFWFGLFSTICTVAASGAVMDATSANSAFPCTVASVRTASYDATTSAEVSAVPLWKAMPSFSVNV
ncbi:hypothetical protein QFZ53_002051 [Microbacterium natoriense]|uniref:Uncharacterized protein n=1 Tax=Microbacterium natoriense TaxID=284570 RepID=A0AAW8EYG4_9MICO|nr:hypothetical protein [Microbacterium natoriense]